MFHDSWSLKVELFERDCSFLQLAPSFSLGLSWKKFLKDSPKLNNSIIISPIKKRDEINKKRSIIYEFFKQQAVANDAKEIEVNILDVRNNKIWHIIRIENFPFNSINKSVLLSVLILRKASCNLLLNPKNIEYPAMLNPSMSGELELISSHKSVKSDLEIKSSVWIWKTRQAKAAVIRDEIETIIHELQPHPDLKILLILRQKHSFITTKYLCPSDSTRHLYKKKAWVC